MFHITEAGPKKCSTTPEKCPLKKDGLPVDHFSDKKDAYAQYEKNMQGETFIKHRKKENLLNNIDENTWKKYGFQSLDFDPSATLSSQESMDLMAESIDEIENLTAAEKEALHFYTTSNFKDFQRVMFRRKDVNNPDDGETYKSLMTELDSALDKANKKDKIIYRGMRGTATIISPDFESGDVDSLLAEFDELSENWDDDYLNDDFGYDDFDEDKKLNDYIKDNLSLGKTIEFKGYQSTTYSPMIASDYASGGILFEIKTPEGMNIKSISEFSSEDEVLLPRETKYKVVGVQSDKAQLTGAKYVVQLVAVNDDGTEKTASNIKDTTKSNWDELMSQPLENPI